MSTPVRRIPEPPRPSAAEEHSLDLVQRVVISVLVAVVVGSIAAVLAAYIALQRDAMDTGDAVGLWCMTGVIGVIATLAILVVNRRRPYSPWVLFGLAPMAASAYWVFG